MTIILGVDPGTRCTGYGLIRVDAHQLEPLDFGCIRPPVTAELPEKYCVIFEGVEALIAKFKPRCVVVETQFVYKNIPSTIKLSMARAMVLLAGARNQLPIHEYAPKKAKLAVVGLGAASKEQVQKMVQLLLKLASPPEPEDAADALALAICHANTLNFQRAYV